MVQDSDNDWKLIKVTEINEENILIYPKKQSRRDSNIIVKGTVPHKREDVLNWSGWGYKDVSFYSKDGITSCSGDRYEFCNQKCPYFHQYLESMFGRKCPKNIYPITYELPSSDQYPATKITANQLEALKRLHLKISTEGSDRLIRSHGQGSEEIELLRQNKLPRITDAVIWPECHEDVVEIVKICQDHNIVIIPIGGGTSVSGSITCPAAETRAILSLDTSMMNEILWVDEESLVVCCEAGIFGQDLERELKEIGFVCGHEPDSIEFSTLGGWVATRASGMKKNTYGNIEDIVVHARMVTPRGVLEKGNRAPRVSCGPDFNHVIMGSEGCFGVITEVCIKVRPLPPYQRYGSLVFPDFESGVGFMREVTRRRMQPASFRLMDNLQYQTGRFFREEPGILGSIVENIKGFYLTKVKGFDLNKMSAVTTLYEGDQDEVLLWESKINKIAADYGGIAGGQRNGKAGYKFTFSIAYLRDFIQPIHLFGESAETSVPWDRVLEVMDLFKSAVAEEADKDNIKHFTMCRIAQTYDAGCCLYFYVMVIDVDFESPTKVVERLIGCGKRKIIERGASLSHHHGVGKMRMIHYEKNVSALGRELFKACKSFLDPKNIFSVGNISEND